jgi:hypothetical protein
MLRQLEMAALTGELVVLVLRLVGQAAVVQSA